MTAADRKRRWRASNKDHAQKKQREYTASWRKRHPETELLRQRKRYPAKRARRRAKEKAALVPLTAEQRAKIFGFYAQARAMTVLTGVPYEVDHIKPLAKGGLHHPDNLQVITRTENRKKGVVDYSQ